MSGVWFRICECKWKMGKLEQGWKMTHSLKPSELARKKLEKRACEQVALINGITPKSLQKSPSQMRSEAGRKKLNRGVTEPVNISNDCRDCEKLKTGCDGNLNACSERSMVLRCLKCGQRVRFRVITG